MWGLPGGGLTSSRLDRWDRGGHIRGPVRSSWRVGTFAVSVGPDTCPQTTSGLPTSRERGRLVVQGILAELGTQLHSGSVGAPAAANLWDSTKTKIVTSLLTVKRAARKSKKNTYRKKIKRMYRRLDRAIALARQDTALGIQSVHNLATRERVAHLTQRIAETKREWMRSKSRRLFQSHAWREDKTTKKLSQRISNKFGDNIIPTLQPDSGPPATTPQAKADTMANAWRSVMQGATATAAAISSTTQWMEQGSSADTERFASCELITESTVGAALLAYKPGKACGADRLGNDWYREHATLLIPILTKLYRLWYAAQVFPASFLEADIFSLKQSGDSSNPLNYRPLALLNTDYKILTRLLTTEIRKTLHHRISRFQNGFVPGRQIHATLHYLAAAQVMAGTPEDARDSLAILLDFEKAYDSLDRDYQYAVLKRHGYPDHFVAVIEKLHSGTSVRFLANGTRSHRIAVTRGIRQGCPLAPILFILAHEPLYQRLERGLVHRGIALTTQVATAELRVAGYADDTAIYIREPAELAPVLKAVEDFGLASGLRLNRSKTVAIALHPDGLRLGAEWTADIKLLATDELCRYLGVQVGSRPSAERHGPSRGSNWKLEFGSQVKRRSPSLNGPVSLQR